MARDKKQRVYHVRSAQVLSGGTPKLPDVDILDYGELAINFADGYETLSIRNSNDEIVTFSSDHIIDGRVSAYTSDYIESGGYINSAVTQLKYFATSANVVSELNNKVDKVDGKELSTNDYTTDDMTKLSGIESGAQVNVQANWSQSSTTADDFIRNKPGLATSASSGFMSSEMVQTIDEWIETEEIMAQAISTIGSRSDVIPESEIVITDTSNNTVYISVSGMQDTTNIITINSEDTTLTDVFIYFQNNGNFVTHNVLIKNEGITNVSVHVDGYELNGTDIVVGDTIYDNITMSGTIIGDTSINVSTNEISELVLTPYIVGERIDIDAELLVNVHHVVNYASLSGFVTLDTKQMITAPKAITGIDTPWGTDPVQKNLFMAVSNSKTTQVVEWIGRSMFGADDLTFLLGTINGMAAIGAHSWTSAKQGTGAAWADIYINPDGDKAVKIGGSPMVGRPSLMILQNSGQTNTGTVKINRNPLLTSSARYKDVACWDDNVSKFNNDAGYITSSDVPSNIDDLSDINITNASDGQVLIYNSSSQEWVNQDIPQESLICTLTETQDPNTNEQTYSCDKTVSEITEAANENKIVFMKLEGESDIEGLSVYLPLSLVASGAVIFSSCISSPWGRSLSMIYGVYDSSTDSDEWGNDSIGLASVATSGNYNDLYDTPILGTASELDVPESGNASQTQVVKGDDTRLTDARPASDVSAWAKADTKPSYTAAEVGALSASTKYGASIDLNINDNTFVISAQLKDQDGNNLGNAQTIDLPLESVVVSGTYISSAKTVALVLKNGSNVEFSVADLVSGLQNEITSTNKLSADLVEDGTTNKVLTASDKTKLNNLTTNIATSGQSGYMSSDMVVKLNGIETGAEANVQADWTQSATTADDYIKNKPTIPEIVIREWTIQ